MPEPYSIHIHFFDRNGSQTIACIEQPRKCIVQSNFGALRKRCWIELHNEDSLLEIELDDWCEVRIRSVLCFRGRVIQRRIDSIDDYLSLYAEWNPEQQFETKITGEFHGLTATQILSRILESTGLIWNNQAESSSELGKIVFDRDSIFQAIDLLAKVSGNWMWDIREDSTLSFRPRTTLPDHSISLDLNRDTVNIRQSIVNSFSSILIQCGFSDGLMYSILYPPNTDAISEAVRQSIRVDAVASLDAMALLRAAVEQQFSRYRYEHYIDLFERGENIQPGETVRFLVDRFPLFPVDTQFRVKQREIAYSHRTLKTRLVLTTGFESSTHYFSYFFEDEPHEDLPDLYESNAFQLDVSALDSAKHLDAPLW